jgi:hypothetical protein
MTITKESPRLRQSLCIVPLMASVACGSVAGTDHKGNSLLQISGSVRIDNEDAPADLVPALAFETKDGFLIQDVEVRGEFPAKFTLNVYEPPPPETIMRDSQRPALAGGYLTAVPPDHERIIPLPYFYPGDPIDQIACDGTPAEVVDEWCTIDRKCYQERKVCTCPVPADKWNPGPATCGEVLETSGDPAIKNPWSKFGGVSQNFFILYVPEASLEALNEEPFFSQEYTGGKGFKLGYNLIHARHTTPEEKQAAAECEPAIRAQAWAEYNAAHGTDYSQDTDLETDAYLDASSWVNSRFAELQLTIYCPDNEWIQTAVDPDSTSIEVQLGTVSWPFSK